MPPVTESDYFKLMFAVIESAGVSNVDWAAVSSTLGLDNPRIARRRWDALKKKEGVLSTLAASPAKTIKGFAGVKKSKSKPRPRKSAKKVEQENAGVKGGKDEASTEFDDGGVIYANSKLAEYYPEGEETE